MATQSELEELLKNKEIEVEMKKQYISQNEKALRESMTKIKTEIMTNPNTVWLMSEIFSIPIEWHPDLAMPTACTDGKKIWIDPIFWNKLNTKPKKVRVLCHETVHKLFGHANFKRVNKRSAELWNIAADCVTESMLEQAGVGQHIGGTIPVGHGGTVTLKINGKKIVIKEAFKQTVEAVYDQLRQHVKDNPGKGDGITITDGDGDDVQQMDEMQEHPYSETEITDTKNNVRRKLIEAKSRGDMPGWLQEVLDANLKAKVDYRSELREFIMPEIKAYSTFSRTNRRTYGTMMPGIILPGMKREGLFVHFYVDTSGSIGQLEARQFISEIKGMFKQFDPGMVTAQIHLHDTTVYSTIDAHSLQDVETVEIRGGGGTSHIQPMENAEDEGAQVAIFLTDGYSDFPESTKIPKMLWVVTSEDGAKRIPEHFGKRIIIAPEDLRE